MPDANVRFLSPLERALYLKTLEPLRDLSSEELAAVAVKLRERHFKKGAVVLRSGVRVPGVHVITEGRIRERSPIGDVVLGAGEAVGVLPMLARIDGPDAEALEETRTLEILSDDMFDVLEDHFGVMLSQIRATSARILEERRHIQDGTYLAPAQALQVPDADEFDLVERLLFILNGGVFQHTSLDAVVQVARSLDERQVAGGTTLWRSGSPSDITWIIVKGSVRCTLDDGTHFRAGPGYRLGNLEAMCGAPRWYEAVTESRVVALTGSIERFTDVLEDHFDMALDLLSARARNLMHILREKNDRAASGQTRAA